MKFETLAISATCLAALAAAEGYHYYSNDELVVMGCKGAVYGTAQYCSTDTAAKYTCNCKNQAAMGSLINCIYDKLGEHNEGGEDVFIDYCSELNITVTHEKLRKSYDNATEYLFDPSDVDGFNKTAISYAPAIYSNKLYKRYYTSLKVRWRNVSDSLYMGAGILGYWLLIIVIGSIYNLLQRGGFIGRYFKSGPINWVRRFITLPSLFSNKRHSHPIQFLKVFQGFLPTRWESIVIFIHFVLLFTFCGVRYHYVENDTIWKTREGQAARYPGDRTGIILVFTYQLTFLFAGRNNFLIWITGWRQSTFYTYHKWVSRINFILTLIHAGSMHCQSVGLGKFESRVATQWYRMGIVATTAAGILVFSACYQMRKNYYEVFLAIHFAMAAVMIAGSWIHTANFGFEGSFYAATAVWAFDRLVRILRMVSFGVQKAQVTVMSDEILKVVIPRHKYWKAFPGSYGYLSYLRPTTFLQSHPFTVVDTSETHITFYTKIKGGVTSQIHRYLRNQPDQTGTIKVTVEGPYGNPFPLKRYNTALFYSGGTGIAGPYAQVKSLIKAGKDQHIKLYWIIRNPSSLFWFTEELLKLKGTAAKVIIYITKPDGFEAPSTASDSNEKTSSIDEKASDLTGVPPGLDFVEFRFGRPDVEALVASDIREANGHVAVVAAAHNSIVDDVRFAVGENLNNTQYRVDYLEELQTW